MIKSYFELQVMSRKLLKFKDEENLSYQKMADLVGIDKSYLYKVFNLQVAPSLETVRQLATFMGIPLYVLFIPTDEDFRISFSESINRSLELQGWDVEDLHEATGISILRINDLLEAIGDPLEEELKLIVETLKIEIVDFAAYRSMRKETIKKLLDEMTRDERQIKIVLGYIDKYFL